MFSRANHALLALAVLTHAAACAEEKADPRFAAEQASASAGDGGAKPGDGGKKPGDDGTKGDDDGAKPDGGTGGGGDFASFDEAVEEAIAAYNESPDGGAPIEGASAVVIDKDEGLVHQQGYGDFEADRVYLIASASKILSVGVLMRLDDMGKLDIDAPIGDYLEEWGDSPVGEVTVAQLVSNSSGLPSLGEVVAAATDSESPYASNLCQYAPMGTLQDCGKLLYATEPPRGPAEEFAYGGSQWQLAGAVAEVVSGKSWAELIQETYVEPCGVDSLGYTNPFGTGATGYPAFDPENPVASDNPNIEGGAYITAPDYAKILMMHMNGGKCGDEQVLSEEAVERMQEDTVAAYEGSTGRAQVPGYGLGWWLNEDKSVVADPGAWGAYPFIDLERGYAAMLMIENTSAVGAQIMLGVKPALDAVFEGE